MGNGSSVMDNEFGERIDNEFDAVYRINRFKTEGFEKYVGTKVDGWFLADNGVQWLENETDKVEGSTRWKNFNYIYLKTPDEINRKLLSNYIKLSKSFIRKLKMF